MMRICLHPDARAFLARAEPWLELAEMEHVMALQTARVARNGDWQFPEPPYWATVEDRERIVGCAFRTPPYRLGITALPPDAIPPLVESVGAVYGALSGVAGPEPAASAFTAAWSELRGASAFLQARQQLLVHKVIVPSAAPPPGALRPAVPADGPLALHWGTAFANESGLVGLDGALCARLIGEKRLYVWEDGTVRCMVGVLRETRDAAAIGIVYTPPELRDRGYATAAIAAFSKHLLDRGLTYSYFCVDPANAAADKLCRKLGYDLVQETVDIDFAVA
jgi:uncharacterized protein